MGDREQVIADVQEAISILGKVDEPTFWLDFVINAMYDALALLKEQEPATVEPKRLELADETKAWLDKMDAVDALSNIADICIDWDGYRTADGLGGLINEIWAYAGYCADRLMEQQKPRVMTLSELERAEIAYAEDKDKPEIIAVLVNGRHYDHFTMIMARSGGTMHVFRPSIFDYSKRWRCWTSRPTEAEREAIPWN